MNGHISDTEAIADLSSQLEGVCFYQHISGKQAAIESLKKQLQGMRIYEVPYKFKRKSVRKLFDERNHQNEVAATDPKIKKTKQKNERPKAEYSNTSPYGIAQEYLLNQGKQ